MSSISDIFRLRRPEFWPSLLACGSVILFLTLGSWQLERLQWKEGLIAQYQQLQSQPAISILQLLPAETAEKEFLKARAAGNFIPDKEFHLAARYHNGKLGYDVISVMEVSGEVIKPGSPQFPLLLVNRGWIPAEKKLPETRKETIPSKDRITVEGRIHPPARQGLFTPDNQPEENLWFWVDIPAIEKILKRPAYPVVLDIVTDNAREEKLPIPNSDKVHFRNDHLGYAITWFALGLVTVVMWAAYHRKKPA